MISSTNEKAPDWVQPKTVRRFPETNITTTNDKNNNSSIIPEIQHRSWANERDTEPIDRKMQSQYSTSLRSSSNTRSTDSDLPTNPLSKKPHINSHPNTLGDEMSFNPLINYMSANKESESIVTKDSHTSSVISTHKTVAIEATQDNDSFAKLVLQNGEYLVKYDTWHGFRGPVETKKCSNKVIERNENVWEFIKIEYNYFKLLLNIKEVYCKAYPYIDAGNAEIGRLSSANRSELNDSRRTTSYSESKDKSKNVFESIDTILPGIDSMIEYHAKITDVLINNHLIRPDRVITEIGRVMNESVPDDFIPKLAHLYGCINFAKKFSSEKINVFKKYNEFAAYIHKCERDPRCEKKTVSDILLIISMHWTKKLTTLASIINNTMNDSVDKNNLTLFKEKVDNILNEASNEMEYMMNLKYLKGLVENYEITPFMPDSERAHQFMTAGDVKLIFYGKLFFELKKSSYGKPVTKEIHGIALEKCTFFLQTVHEPGKTTPKYQLFKDQESAFPALLKWGELSGFFREEEGKISDLYSFYILIDKKYPSMVRMSVATAHELTRWKQCISQGFSQETSENSELNEAEGQLNTELKKIERKWTNTQFGIELIKNLDHSLKVQLEYRTVGFRCLLEEELKRLSISNGVSRRDSRNSTLAINDVDEKKNDMDYRDSSCTETFLPDLTTKEGIQDWLDLFIEWVNRLKFSLCSSGANITRSASEIEARKRPSIPTVKKCETFSSRDTPNNEKRQTDVTFLNPPITKQKKDQRRISVSGFTNLFRINSKSVKPDDCDKTIDTTISPATNLDTDNNISALENLEMISESDCFLMGLSKDTVTAFNEINIAAKNITCELLNLRAQNTCLESDLKKTREENQSYCEFVRKYKKTIPDNPMSVSFGENSHKKTESGNLEIVGSHVVGNYEQSCDRTESLNEHFYGSANIKRQTESLREKYNQFEIEKKAWSKEYESQRKQNANDKENIFAKTQELQKDREALLEKERKYQEKCKILQDKVDKYNLAYDFNLEEDKPTQHVDSSSNPNMKIISTTPHSRGHVDDISHQRSSKHAISTLGLISPPLASTEATLYNSDQSVHTDPMHNSNIPDHMKGSLINQYAMSSHSIITNKSERQSLKTNSSDNTLDTRGKVSSNSVPKSKLTPTTDRKEIYSSSNTCFTRDDKEDRDFSSDVDDSRGSSNISIRNTVDIVERRTTVTKTVSATDNSKPAVRNSVITHTTSDTTGAKPLGLGIPVGLATKSKVKSKKTK